MRARKYTEKYGAKREERQQSQKATQAASSDSAVAEVATHANCDYTASEKDLLAEHTTATHDNCDYTPSERDLLVEHTTASAVADNWTGNSWGDDAEWGYGDTAHLADDANWGRWPTEQANISAVADISHPEEPISHSEEPRIWNASNPPPCTGHTHLFNGVATNEDFLHCSSHSEISSPTDWETYRWASRLRSMNIPISLLPGPTELGVLDQMFVDRAKQGNVFSLDWHQGGK